MCFSSAHLFFGLTVPTLELVLAARIASTRMQEQRVLEMMAKRRACGALRVALPARATICDLPLEVLELVKHELAQLMWEEEQDRLVWEMWHEPGEQRCRCALCHRHKNGERWIDIRPLDFEHISECRVCDYMFSSLGGGIALLEENEQSVKALLRRFGLELIVAVPISASDSPRTAPDSSCAVALPTRASTSPTEISHDSFDYTHHLVSLSPSIFQLPPDAYLRFERLLRAFPLSVTNKRSFCFTTEPPRSKAGGVKRAQEDGLKKRTPRWHLWSLGKHCA